MTKSKRQLRAEAVERLSNLGEVGYYYEIVDALCDADCDNWTSEKVATTIRDLLTDDEPSDDCGHFADMSEKGGDCVRSGVEMSEIDVSAEGEHANDVDSREKLEASVMKYLGLPEDCRAWGDFGAVKKWLDRQAAITERENDRLIVTMQVRLANQDRRIVELSDELEKRDKGIERLKRRRDELQEEVEEMQDELKRVWKESTKWKARCAELQAEVDALRAREKPRQEPSEAVCAPINDKSVTECGNAVRGAEIGSESPELDALEFARWRWKYRPEDGDEVIMNEYNTNLLMGDLDGIVDMVERDYVRRDEALAKLARANREREIYRDACGRLLDLADEMRLVRLDGCDDGYWVDMDGEVIS